MADDRMPALPNAACRDPKASPHFVIRNGGRQVVERAAKVCNSCWDRPECLAWGIQHEDTGIWGGHGRTGLDAFRREFAVPFNQIGTTGWADVSWAPRGTKS